MWYRGLCTESRSVRDSTCLRTCSPIKVEVVLYSRTPKDFHGCEGLETYRDLTQGEGGGTSGRDSVGVRKRSEVESSIQVLHP